MIDRQARDQVAAALKSYLSGESTAFQLNDQLFGGRIKSRDRTLESLIWAIWCHYDDIKDHPVVATKDEWDQLNRILLFLESDGEIEPVGAHRKWHVRQAIAALSLAGFVAVASCVGMGDHLLIYAMPFGVISMGLSWWKRRDEQRQWQKQSPLLPFPSLSSLRAVRRMLPGFRKMRYPGEIGNRRIRSRLLDRAYMLQFGVFWLILSPLVLLFQMLPQMETKETIRVGGQTMTITNTD